MFCGQQEVNHGGVMRRGQGRKLEGNCADGIQLMWGLGVGVSAWLQTHQTAGQGKPRHGLRPAMPRGRSSQHKAGFTTLSILPAQGVAAAGRWPRRIMLASCSILVCLDENRWNYDWAISHLISLFLIIISNWIYYFKFTFISAKDLWLGTLAWVRNSKSLFHLFAEISLFVKCE
jgi:hypothetical protein